MASTRKSRSVNKRFAKVNEESPDKDGGSGNKSRQRKKKYCDMLGAQWSKEELQRFYEAYRKYGQDWKKVAGIVRNRSPEMVDALYMMNKAYLSLPEGTASVVGLIAMMTDHYSIMEGSESERESNDDPGVSRKPQKRGRGKLRSTAKGSDDPVPDLLRSQSALSNYGCLSLLKKKRSGGSRPRAVGKRTPRFPVSYSYENYDEQKWTSPNKQVRKLEADANDDELAVMVLAEALPRGGSPQVSQTPKRRKESMRHSFVRNGERMHVADDDGFEGSLESREAENGDLARDTSYMMDTEGVGTVEVQRKGKRSRGKKSKFQDTEIDHFDDVREACSGTEGLAGTSVKEKEEDEVTDIISGRPSPHGPRKRSRQLFFGDESSALDALCTLADLSMKLAPTSTVESESSVQFKEQKIAPDMVEKSRRPEAVSLNRQRGKAKVPGSKEKAYQLVAEVDISAHKNIHRETGFNAISEEQSTVKVRKRKRKSFAGMLETPVFEANSDSKLSEAHKIEAVAEEGNKSISKNKRMAQIVPIQKQGKLVRPLERSSSSNINPPRMGTSSTVQVSSASQVNLPTKLRSRRKQAFVRKEAKSPENIGKDRSNNFSRAFHNRALDLKEKLSSCLSSQMLRRWCAFEWFYSAIDYPWFAKREFVEYLDHVGLGHVPRLTRVEWGVIRSSLGKPRRLSQQFLHEEKEKLEQYRESVRTHYTELRAGIREGLPTDLAQPLSVGQRVIACHPKTRELHDGSVLTVDRNKCRVQFDRPELGVEFVMDIDCMPLNPLENLPEALRRQAIVGEKSQENFSESKPNGRSKAYSKVAPSENQEIAEGTSQFSSPCSMDTLVKHSEVDTMNAFSQAKAAACEISSAQKATQTQPCTLAQIQAREADVRALSELTRALDKKEALVSELRNMNDELLSRQTTNDTTLKDSEPFKKQYATVLIQLKEANDQVSSALLYLRQRNTYQSNPPPPWLKPITTPGPLPSSDQSFLPQETGSRVLEILETSRLKAQIMVEAAVEAMSTLKDGDEPFTKVGEALDCAPSDHESTSFVKVGDVQIPSELISSCVATLVMIQTCTERQYPPAEVAQILDSAVTNLQPYCSQNLPVYREIQMCMGLVKNQILALIPT